MVTRDGLRHSMRTKIEENDQDYPSPPHEKCCGLLSKLEVKDDRKGASPYIKKKDSNQKVVHESSDSYFSPWVFSNNKKASDDKKTVGKFRF